MNALVKGAQKCDQKPSRTSREAEKLPDKPRSRQAEKLRSREAGKPRGQEAQGMTRLK